VGGVDPAGQGGRGVHQAEAEELTMLDTTPVAATIKHLISTGTTEQVLLGNKASLGSVEALLTARAHLHPGKVLSSPQSFAQLSRKPRNDRIRAGWPCGFTNPTAFKKRGQIIDGDIVMVRRKDLQGTKNI
jgi:hypothetical protein